jgi:hypothetical protein
LLALLAESVWEVEQPEEGLLVLAEALAEVHKGWRYCEAELYRLKGELLLGLSAENHAEADACFHQALDIAPSPAGEVARAAGSSEPRSPLAAPG